MVTIILPGIGGSGEAHWQTIWEQADPSMVRFRPTSWDTPDLTDWMRALDQAIAETNEPPLLVAHSLGCLLVAHWAASKGRVAVRGAFLVAVPDPNGPAFPRAAPSFRDLPGEPLPFPSLVVASRDDPYATLDYDKEQAAQWGAGFVDVGLHGHINEASGLGEWPTGVGLLEAFRAGLSNPNASGQLHQLGLEGRDQETRR